MRVVRMIVCQFYLVSTHFVPCLIVIAIKCQPTRGLASVLAQ